MGHLSLVFSNQCFLEKPKVESLSSSESKGRRELKRTLIQGALLSRREGRSAGQTSLLRAPPPQALRQAQEHATEESDPLASHHPEKKSRSPRWAQRLLGQLLAMYRSVWVPLARGDEGRGGTLSFCQEVATGGRSGPRGLRQTGVSVRAAAFP